ncbi:MAG: hypothetical protein ABW046_21910 [Actinoplanes sp.]
MADRPHNARPASSTARDPGARNVRRRVSEPRTEDNQIANHAYRGSHRAGSVHHADEQTAAENRSSRVGRHHADQAEEGTRRG